MFIVVGGLGNIGKAVLHYLIQTTDEKILVVDIKSPETKLDKVEYTQENYKKVFVNINKGATVISCLPVHMNYEVATLCKYNKLNMVSLGGDMNGIYKIETGGITIVPGCGLAPGIVSSLAAKFIETEENLKSIRAYWGNLPKFPRPLLSYAKSHNFDNIMKKYSGVATEIEDGKIINHPVLSGVEKIFVPSLGVLDSARVCDGFFNINKLDIQDLSCKILQYPGHFAYMERFVFSKNQKDSLAVLKEVVPLTDYNNPDVVILMFKLGYYDGTEDIMDYYWEYDYENNISAMAQVVGYTAAAVATLIQEDFVKDGVVGMEEIDSDKIISKVEEIEDQYLDAPFNFEED